MNTLFMIPGAISSLHSFELFLIIVASIGLGYIGKQMFDKYRSRSGMMDASEELQLKLDTLQNKFSSEILRKEEAESVLHDELKAAEKRHMELQVQYAKALTHIEQLRQGNESDYDDVETEAGHLILQNLQDKIARQERRLLELEQQLRNTEQEKLRVHEAYELLKENSNSKDLLADQFEQDRRKYEEQLQEKIAEAERLKIQFGVELSEARLQVEKLQQQVMRAEATEREQLLEDEIKQLKERLNAAEATRTINEDILEQKAGITATRIHATQVAEKVEEFRDHLTAILRDTYSYEQLLASNERLNENITRLQTEKRMAEEEILELQEVAKEKLKLEEQVELVNNSLEQKKNAWKEKLQEFEFSLTQLSKQVQEKEHTIEQYIREREELSLQIEMLQHKLDEREQLSREMILAMKDIETRFAHFNHATGESAVVNGEGEMQYQ